MEFGTGKRLTLSMVHMLGSFLPTHKKARSPRSILMTESCNVYIQSVHYLQYAVEGSKWGLDHALYKLPKLV